MALVLFRLLAVVSYSMFSLKYLMKTGLERGECMPAESTLDGIATGGFVIGTLLTNSFSTGSFVNGFFATEAFVIGSFASSRSTLSVCTPGSSVCVGTLNEVGTGAGIFELGALETGTFQTGVFAAGIGIIGVRVLDEFATGGFAISKSVLGAGALGRTASDLVTLG